MDSVEEMVGGSFEQIVELMSSWGLQVIGAIAVLIVGRWAAGFIRKNVQRALERARTDASLVLFVSSCAMPFRSHHLGDEVLFDERAAIGRVLAHEEVEALPDLPQVVHVHRDQPRIFAHEGAELGR